jgi:hypothetical protein
MTPARLAQEPVAPFSAIEVDTSDTLASDTPLIFLRA